MESITRHKRFNLISLITIIVIILVFGYYYFFYVKYKEIIFHEKAFRNMEQVEQNVTEKYSNDLKVIWNSIEQAGIESQNAEDFRYKFYHYFDTTGFPVELKIEKYFSPFEKPNMIVTFDSSKIKVELQSKLFEATLSFKIKRLLNQTLQYDFFKNYIVFSKEPTKNGKIIYSDIPISPDVEISYDSVIKKSNIRHSSIISSIYYNGKPHAVYLIPVNLKDVSTIYIGGLIDKEFFTRESFKLNPIILAAIFFVLVMLILSLPIFKLALLSDCERMSTKDVILSFAVKILGTAFLTLMILYLFSKYGPEYENRKHLLKSYGDQIETGLMEEIRNNLKIIEDKDKGQLKKGNVEGKYYYDNKSSLYQFDFLTWINKYGYQLARMQPKKITPRVNVSERDYFKNPLNDRLWKDESISDSGFYFGSIVSWTTGKHYAIISKKSSTSKLLSKPEGKNPFRKELETYKDTNQFFKPYVVTLGTELKCLDSLYLPTQVSYMIIDQKGRVLFHKEKSKGLQENLLKETKNNFELKSALHGYKNMTFFQSYNSKKRMFHVSRIGKLPLFIVTFLDYDYEYIVDVQILSLTSLLYVTFFLSLILITLIYLLIDYKKSYKVESRELFFSWFWPSQKKGKVYITLILSLIISGFLYFILGIYRNIYTSYLFFFMVYLLNIFSLKHSQLAKETLGQRKDQVFFSTTLLLGLFLNFMIPNATIFQKISVLVSVLLVILIINHSEWISARLKFLKPEKYASHFNAYIFFLIFFLGLLPVYSFYKNAWEYEKELYVKNLQLSIAQNVDPKTLNSSGKTIFKSFTEITKGSSHFSSASDEPESGFIKRLRIVLDTSVVVSDVLNMKSSDDSNRFMSNNSVLSYSSGSGLTIQSPRPLFSIISLIKHKFEEKGIVLILFGSLVLLLFMAYYLVTFWSRKVFLLKLIPYHHKDVNKMLNSNQDCIIVTTAFSKGVTHLLEKISEYSKHPLDNTNLPLIDLSHAGDFSFIQTEVRRVTEKQFPKILIADFEGYSRRNIEIKIKLITSLKEYDRVNNIQQQLIILTPHLLTNINTKDYDLEEFTFDRYLDATSEFQKSYLSLSELKLPIIKLDPLHDHEDAILYKQNKIQVFYQSLWQNCTKREQYLIYDIAQDGLLNPSNLPVIYNLLKKGIFKRDGDGRIILFNNSFRNFVLTIINREEALQLEKEAKIQGLWSNMKLPIILVILALFIMVFVTNQGVFNNMIGWLTAALGSVAVLSRVFSGFSMLNIFKGSGK